MKKWCLGRWWTEIHIVLLSCQPTNEPNGTICLTKIESHPSTLDKVKVAMAYWPAHFTFFLLHTWTQTKYKHKCVGHCWILEWTRQELWRCQAFYSYLTGGNKRSVSRY